MNRANPTKGGEHPEPGLARCLRARVGASIPDVHLGNGGDVGNAAGTPWPMTRARLISTCSLHGYNAVSIATVVLSVYY